MKNTIRAQLGQSVNLTPQLLQSIRLLQLTAPQLEMELREALERNPLLEQAEPEPEDEALDASAADEATLEAAAWDELPEPAYLSAGAGLASGDADATARIAAGESSDPRVRLLQQLALKWSEDDLAVASWWLDHSDDRGYLEAPLPELITRGAHALSLDPRELEAVRQRLLHGEWPGMAAATASECLLAQLRAERPGDRRDAEMRTLAECILTCHLDLLATHDYTRLAAVLGSEPSLVESAAALILGLRPSAIEEPREPVDTHIVPDVVVRLLGGAWRVALNGRTAPRLRIAPHCEQALAGGGGDHGVLRGLLDEARWLVRGIAMRNDTLLRTAQVLVERQQGFLERGEEAIAPLTLREVADAIGMHESTVSRITSGKYIQTPRGTFELKRLFAVRLEGAAVSGSAVKAMVKRLIDAEPAHAPLADDVIAGLLARQGVRIARRTVAKYRDQLAIGPARARQRAAATPTYAAAG
ncbi:RNA polymerase factor sigma-54 [Lysobacter sp. D1-1-M9]|uniref:RNA polymerase factor sigma-54 n=1 Tax=Novilysobacter longmucuonensis TaxID=3098603 RepID=UPI002FC7E0E8